MPKNRGDKKSFWKMPHLIWIGLDVIVPLEWCRNKVLSYDFTVSETVFRHIVGISSVFLIHEWALFELLSVTLLRLAELILTLNC